MNYESQIIVKTKTPNDLLKVFEPEKKDSKTKRSTYTINKQSGGLIFDIRAKDSVSLRATLNSITKLLTVYEKLI
ncbi:hypothetical protein GOV05_04220 [Candidatus Woesearchaeota archaeon]|nr:hypothetical protein [Candidatus Woesearchaeota archaeon]